MLTHTYVHPARHRAQLTLADVSLMRGATPVLNHVDLTVTAQSRIAIVGENGRGKSTLLYVLAGVLSPDSGSVQRTGTLGLAEQEMTATDSRTVGQAVAEAMAVPRAAVLALDAAASALADDREGAAEEYAAALEFAGAIQAWDAERRVQIALEALDAETDMTRLLADLSVGQRYRVRLACLLGSEDDFLLLDEPTNHLDRSGLEFLTAQLRARSGGVIIVSHDRALLSDIAETIIDLDPAPDNRPRIYGSGYAGYQEGRLSERERWEQDYERQQAEHTRLQESLSAAQNRLISGWRPEKGTNKHGRATSVSFTLSHRGRLVVTGPNGAGKSTLLRVVSGELVQDTGTIQRPGSTRIGFLHQESALPLDRRASEVYAAHIGALVSAGVLLQSEVVSLSQLGLLRPRETGKRVGELSMGQQRRLDLALVLSNRPHLLLLDEPTNHLSFTLVDELTIALGATQAAVVLSSHDRQLLRDVASWPQLQLTARAEGDVLA